jgi:hypothetical protein
VKPIRLCKSIDGPTAPLDGRLHIACFVIRGETFRPISLREANKDERREYEKATKAAKPT